MIKKSLFICVGFLLFAPLFGMPRIIKEVLETNSRYLSWVSAPSAWSGGGWIISNHISRRGYNVGGKIVKVWAEPAGSGIFLVGGSEPFRMDDEEADFWETGDRPGPDRLIEKEREEKKRRDTPKVEGEAVQAKTDLFGRVLFTFIPAAQFRGVVDVRVCFVNQSTGFSEHVVLHRLEIRSRTAFLLESVILALLLCALAVASVLTAKAVWRPEPPVVALLLFPWFGAWGGKPVSVKLLRQWAVFFALDGLLLAWGYQAMPGVGWAAVCAIPLLLMLRAIGERLGMGTVLLMGLLVAQILLGTWLSHWGAAEFFGSLASLTPWVWIVAPVVALLLPSPALAFPVLAWLLKGEVLDINQALISIPVFLGAYLLLEWRKRER
jgi:hypothetical protein